MGKDAFQQFTFQKSPSSTQVFKVGKREIKKESVQSFVRILFKIDIGAYIIAFALGFVFLKDNVASGSRLDAGIGLLVFSIISTLWAWGGVFAGVGYIWRMASQYELLLSYTDIIGGGNWLTWLYFYPAYAFACAFNCFLILLVIWLILTTMRDRVPS